MDINETVAGNLRQIRRSQGLSLEELARESGVSKSMLGQIERSEVNPTITVLNKIARGLKTSLEQLLQQREEPVTLLRDADIFSVIDPGSTALRFPIFPYEAERGIEGYRLKLLPGFRQVCPAAAAGTVKYITVFDGLLELEIGDSRYQLRQFDSIRFAADVPHSCRNGGDRTVNLQVWVSYAP